MSRTPVVLSKPFLAAAAGISFAACALLTGCGVGNPAASSAVTGSIQQSGRTMGGQQPVSGSTIDLWKAGTTGTYGTGASLLYQTTTDGSGGFNLTGKYTCVSGDQLYITAYGGSSNLGVGNNSSIGLLAILGECTFVQSIPSIIINEATTSAGLVAVQQFASTSYGTSGLTTLAATGVPLNIGAPSTNIVGLTNSFLAVYNLIPPNNANIPKNYSHTASIQGTATTVNTLAPYAKIATMANILAACVNSQDTVGTTTTPSSSCNSVLAAAQPAGQASAPADTVQVALDMAINPTNVGTSSTGLYSLASTSAPFQPALTSVPNDWTLGVSYTSPTLVGTVGTGSPAYFLYQPNGLAIDAAGNVYVANTTGFGFSATASPYFPSVTEFSTNGVPVAMYLNGNAYMAGPQTLALDPSGNIWVGMRNITNITEQVVGSSTVNTYTVGNRVNQIASDSAGNIFAAVNNATVYEVTAGQTTSTAATSLGTVPNSNTGYVALDKNLNLWVSNTSTSSTAGDQALDFFACTPSTGTVCSNTTTNSYSAPTKFNSFPSLNSALGEPYGLAIDKNNNVFVSLGAYNDVAGYGCELLMTAASVGTATTPTCSTNNLAGLSGPSQAQIDGSGNIWVTNEHVNVGAFYQISGVNYNSGTYSSLSGTVGFGNTETTQPALVQIDQSGNVWQAAYNPTSSAYYIFETIGVAAPTIQPTALGLKNGKLGQKP